MTITQPIIKMTEQEYHAAPGLSNSGMRDLAISPLRYWHRWINPNRQPVEPSAEMQFGSALHCLVLEPGEFESRYCCQLCPNDIEGCLTTMDDLRRWLRDKGQTPKGKLKAELTVQVLQYDPSAPVLDVLEDLHASEHRGKVMFSKEDWTRLYGAKDSLMSEPRMKRILGDEGRAEYPIFTVDRESGVALKGKLDWLSPTLTLDVKTFSQKRGRSIDRSVADAILYESYYRQAYFYGLLRGWPQSFSGEFVMAFVESAEPFEVRLKVLRPKFGLEPNLYWIKAQLECRNLIRTFAECTQHFGEKPWRYAREIEPLVDQDMPGIGFAA
jgi:hypothetical protein